MDILWWKRTLRMIPRKFIYSIGLIGITCLLYKTITISEEQSTRDPVKLLEDRTSSNVTPKKKKHLKVFHKIVHLDLKGAPPKLEYLRRIIPLVRKWGATGLLMEYEDMFPYSKNMKVLARSNAYNTSTIAEILSLAAENDLMIIPLVQTFGHLEFALKHPKFSHIREVQNKIKNLNPAHSDSFPVVKEMIDQMLSLHPKIKYLHIGCDEVYYMGHSKESKALMKQKDLDRSGLFLHHVLQILKYMKDTYPGVKPIMWDDMLRRIGTSQLQKHNIGLLVEPMVWGYTPDVYRKFPSSFWDKYTKVFNQIWTASSFKGATGQKQIVVNIDYHLRNQKAWTKIMKEARSEHNFSFRGIALTGWQRYDHTLPLCELLPVGIPSLTACLQCITDGIFDSEVHQQVTTMLQCDHQLNLIPATTTKEHSNCTFPGSDIYDAVTELKRTQIHLGKLVKEKVHSGSTMELIRGRVMSHIKSLPPVLLTALEEDAVREFLQTQLIRSLKTIPDLHKEALTMLKELYRWM